MSRQTDNEMPEYLRNADLDTKVAVLYERVLTLRDEVRSLKNVVLTAAGTVLSGMVLGLFSIAAGWIGPHAAQTSMAHVIGWLL